MSWFKKNWVMILSALIALFGGADVAVGMSQGKSLLNIMNLPSLAMAAGGLTSLGFKGIKTLKSGASRPATVGLTDSTSRVMEAIFVISEDQDVNDEMILDLSKIAAATLVGHAARVKSARLKR